MSWNAYFHPKFKTEFDELSVPVQTRWLGMLILLREFGPALGRPDVDTLKGSKYTNMKELRFKVDGGVWRAAFAFDPDRDAIILVAADKSGSSQTTFYRRLIEKADKRFREHLEA